MDQTMDNTELKEFDINEFEESDSDEVNSEDMYGLYIEALYELPRDYDEKELAELFEKYTNYDEDATNKIINIGVYRVLRIARRHGFINNQDAFQEGILAMLSSIRKPLRACTPSIESLLATGEYNTVVSVGKHHMNNNLIKIPRDYYMYNSMIYHSMDYLYGNLHRLPNIEEISNHCSIDKLTVQNVMLLFSFFYRPVSIEQISEENTDLYSDNVVNVLNSSFTDNTNPENIVVKNSLKGQLIKAIETLSPLQQNVINLLFGIADNNPRCATKVAEILNISSRGVIQISVKALRKLKKYCNENGIREYWEDMYE